jgi:hypothetical protein
MSRISLALLLGITLMAAACGYSSSNYQAPQVAQLVPATAAVGGAPFVLTVNGTGFGTDSVVFWDSMARPTTYVSATQVTANIPAEDIMNAGTVQVFVRSSGANSNAVTYQIQ